MALSVEFVVIKETIVKYRVLADDKEKVGELCKMNGSKNLSPKNTKHMQKGRITTGRDRSEYDKKD